jgi:sister-chromatid-cohesion protein PDS5
VGLILHIAQRVKQTVDAIDRAKSEGLYHLSELAQEVVRRWASHHGWALEVWPGKVRLPVGLFAAVGGHEEAQSLATREYVTAEVREKLDALVRTTLRGRTGGKKRRAGEEAAGDGAAGASKRKKSASSATLPIRKQSAKSGKKSRKRDADFDEDEDEGVDMVSEGVVPPSSVERRRSGRATATAGKKTYAESSGSEVEAEAEAEAEEDEDEDEEMGEAASEEHEEEAPLELPPPKRASTNTKTKKKTNGKANPPPRRTGGRTRAAAAAIPSEDEEGNGSELSDAPESE